MCADAGWRFRRASVWLPSPRLGPCGRPSAEDRRCARFDRPCCFSGSAYTDCWRHEFIPEQGASGNAGGASWFHSCARDPASLRSAFGELRIEVIAVIVHAILFGGALVAGLGHSWSASISTAMRGSALGLRQLGWRARARGHSRVHCLRFRIDAAPASIARVAFPVDRSQAAAAMSSCPNRSLQGTPGWRSLAIRTPLTRRP